ncbi:MAG: sugar transferase [Chloroflexi bacterium]|nr:sugar transferase [Ardenticatenaceae bacterium]MBL1128091.1 sugar transferase [Chloroflexota bacterium]NOG34162.1 sugar transferase [Chloroflexota bacterium]GIK55397.1 MAG: polyprenyl glycosylphosphotransferase [Chloroflexota bacterium]
MLRRQTVNYAIFSMVMDVSFTLLALLIARMVRPYLPATFPFLVSVPKIDIPLILFVIVPLIWGGTFLITSVYDPRRIYKVTDEFQAVTLAVGVATLIFAGVLYLGFRNFSRWLLVTFVLIDLFLLLSWRVIVRLSFRIGRFPIHPRRVLVVGAGKTGQRLAQMVVEYRWTGLDLVGFLDDDPEKHEQQAPLLAPLLGRLADVRRVVQQQQIDDVVIALPRYAYGRVNQLVLDLHDLPVQVRVVPDYFSLALYRASMDDFGGVPMINLRDPALNEVQRFVKRTFDLVIASISIFFLLPALAVIALLIKLDSPGPIFYRHKRVGENSRPFHMYKFRTMIPEADQMLAQMTEVNSQGQLFFKRPDDPRVTRVGHFLRRASLDELPQLFNVLKGDMSLVGPRPELPWLVERYEPWQRKRFAVPQGMTGWWQVNGRSDKPMHLHTEDDLYYVQNYSLWMDIFILLKTPWVVLRGKGAF